MTEIDEILKMPQQGEENGEPKKKLKVLVFTGFSLFGTGSGTLIETQMNELKKAGHEVAVISCENSTAHVSDNSEIMHYPLFFTGQGPNAEKIPGQLPYNFPMFTGSTVSTENFWTMPKEQIEEILTAYGNLVERAINEFQPDVILGNHLWIHLYKVLEVVKTMKANIPVVTTIHGTDLKGYGEKIPEYMKDATGSDKEKLEMYKEMAEVAARDCDKFVVISEAQKKRFNELYPNESDKVELVRNSYNAEKFYRITDKSKEELISEVFPALKGHNDPTTFSEPDDPNAADIPQDFDKMGLFVGKFVDFKGIDSLLRGWKEVEDEMLAQGKKAIFVVVGSGPKDAELRKLAQELGLKSLYFVGRQDASVINKLQSIADVALAPSIEEPDGLVVKEALAAGNPVIGGNSGGIPETLMKDKNDCTLVDEENQVYKTSNGLLIQNEITREVKPDATDEELLESSIAAGKSIASAIKMIFNEEIKYDRETLAKYDYENYSPASNIQHLLKLFRECIMNLMKKKVKNNPNGSEVGGQLGGNGSVSGHSHGAEER